MTVSGAGNVGVVQRAAPHHRCVRCVRCVRCGGGGGGGGEVT